jgi:hypothetical protein
MKLVAVLMALSLAASGFAESATIKKAQENIEQQRQVNQNIVSAVKDSDQSLDDLSAMLKKVAAEDAACRRSVATSCTLCFIAGVVIGGVAVGAVTTSEWVSPQW